MFNNSIIILYIKPTSLISSLTLCKQGWFRNYLYRPAEQYNRFYSYYNASLPRSCDIPMILWYSQAPSGTPMILFYSHDPLIKSISLCERNVTIQVVFLHLCTNKMKLLKFVLLREFRKDVQRRCVICDKLSKHLPS